MATAAMAMAAQVNAQTTVWSSDTGGEFLNEENWTAGVPGPDASAVFNNDLVGVVTLTCSIDTRDLFLRNLSGTVTFDVDPAGAGNQYTMSRFVIVGAAAGESNHMVVTSGELETGLFLIGNAAGADNNRVDMVGAGTVGRATGGTAGTAALRVGSNGGSGNVLNVSEGAMVVSETQTIVGLQGGSDNAIVVSGTGSEFHNAQSISLGDNIADDKPEQTNNQLKVLDGGFVTTRELIIGTTARSPGNTALVSGFGSRLNVRGGQQFPPTEGGQRHDIGRASSNNALIAENGAVVDGNAIFLLGREATSLNNLLSLKDASLTGWGIEVRQGTVVIDNSTLEINREFDDLAEVYLGGSLLAESALAQIDFRSGLLTTVHASIANGSPMTVGDGSANPATYRMKPSENGGNGTHQFADGLMLSSNAVLAGSGDIVGDVAAEPGARVDVGDSTGLIHVDGDWNHAGINLTLELADFTNTIEAGLSHDLLEITGAFAHGGSVVIDLTDLVGPAQPTDVKLIGWGSTTGNPNDTAVSFVGGSALAYQFLGDGLFVTVESTGPVPGDADGDGDVDGFDLGLWQTQFGQMGQDLSADFDDDGDVDGFDLGIWQLNFGTGQNGSAAVPEPATITLAIAALVIAQGRRRGRP